MQMNVRTVEGFCTGFIADFMNSQEFNKYADTHTWEALLGGLLGCLPADTEEYENVEEYVYAISGNNLLCDDFNLGTVLNCIRYQDELPREPFTDSTKPVNSALVESIRMYLVSGAREFILNAWESKFQEPASDTAIIR